MAKPNMWREFLEWSPLRDAKHLSERGIMGMNRRNISYISRYNSRALFPLVDDKLKTKKLALEHGVTVPELIGVIGHQHEVHRIGELAKRALSFCIKPAKGSGGKGILVISRVENDVFFKSNNQALSLADLERHISNILAGLFSLGGATDVAIVEKKIEVDASLTPYSYEGVPDIRVIVFRGIPVMAMMRLSCSASKGKANLHQGAIGVGLSVSGGNAVNAVRKDNTIYNHPDTGQNLLELNLPSWERLLHLACECYDMTGLGYIGVDLVIDKNLGPMLLELNARPGLSIQIANNAGLLPRLKLVETIKYPEKQAVKERVAFAQKHFHAMPSARRPEVTV
ncbi:MAG: alpha-L-glutamate ligase-like protein [Lentisphaeria bacterium]|jgi:alpha-L-glutamate ligase-like protein